MLPIILFRKTWEVQSEFDIAQQYMKVTTLRTACKNEFVIGRYSTLPFYRELEKDLEYNGCRLINTHSEHCWIADFGYYHDLKEFTPDSWTQDNFYLAPEGQYVVKGRTNSRKHQWKTHMFAETKKQAIEICHELLQDPLISSQGIIFRKYEPLRILDVDHINGMPFSNEWRLFFYKTTLLSHGYYWSTAEDETIKLATMNDAGLHFAQTIATIAAEYVNFFVLDIAQKENGDWILIEMNDGTMSGLSENDPHVLYSSLSQVLSGN